MRKILLAGLAATLLLPSLFAAAGTEDSAPAVLAAQSIGIGEASSKHEVVYAKLDASGESKGIYVVNILEVVKAGSLTDYGKYSGLVNLTDVSPLAQGDEAVSLTAASEGKFYYQGNLEGKPLPWDISISYTLNGEEISPEALAGQDGRVQIRIRTSANEQVDPVFYAHYLLQISLSLDSEVFSQIRAPDGMLAIAGKNQQVMFTVMPGRDGDLLLEADVVSFELDGMDITAVPSSMSIDSPDMDGMIGDMEELTNAIGEVHDGVAQLYSGAIDLNNGVVRLRDGSVEYRDGIAAIHASSSELLGASSDIQQALARLDAGLSGGSDAAGLGDLQQLGDGLGRMAAGLRETAGGLGVLQENYAAAYRALNSAIDEIPANTVSEEELQQLYGSGADHAVLDRLVAAYTAAQTAKGMYAAVGGAFAAVEATLEQVSGALTEMAGQVEGMAAGLAVSAGEADGLAQLQEGLRLLASNYEAFHAGLTSYAGGVGQLSGAYGELHQGIVELGEGTDEFRDGVGRLRNGTAELYASTKDMPDQIKSEVDRMMEEYDKSDFEPVSFVSAKNKHVQLVQFVLRTEGIKPLETEEAVEVEEKTTGFWARFKNLFVR